MRILLTAEPVSWNRNSFQSRLPVLFHLYGRGTLHGGIFKEQEIALSSACSFIKRPTAESRGPMGEEGGGVGEGSLPPLTDAQRHLIPELPAFSADTNNDLKSSFKAHQQRFHSCRSFKSANAHQGWIPLQDVVRGAHHGVHVQDREAQKHPGSCVFSVWTCTNGFLTGYFATLTFYYVSRGHGCWK